MHRQISHRLLALLALVCALVAPPALASVRAPSLDIAPRVNVFATPWEEMTHVSAVAGGPAVISTASLPTFPGNPERVRALILQYEISSLGANGLQQRVDNYGVEDMSLAHGASYDGTYGADYRFAVAGNFAGGVAMYHGMCGGVNLSTFDGECDFAAPGGMVVGGSGHNAGLGFPTYRDHKVLSGVVAAEADCEYGELRVSLAITSFCWFEHWTGDPNWVSGGWLDGDKLTVKVRALYVTGAAQ